ncbi:hypothetical protein [Streptomyces reniochalinae]|uniref:Uncharacterized protein n=1 Tax=Streptomyces reniochalinae TaxID=2250578 RepID=A0A367EH18_9ACTN|nr:hypothetical protein [Streptomyces reniochalinae]RCG16490.1 hypothetical protein DQ392_20330 [Streptomyces reniochalinae]
MDPNEPLFKRSPRRDFRQNRHVLNWQNPTGRFLIVLFWVGAVVIGLLALTHTGPFAPPPESSP